MVEYVRGDFKSVSKLKKLWVESFNDTSKGYLNFIKTNKKNVRIYMAKSEGAIVSALYHIPVTVSNIKAHYLYGASTEERQRGKGIMRHLIDYSLQDAHSLGEELSVLYPADSHLYGYYGRLGFERKCHRKTADVTREQLMNIAEYSGFCLSMNLKEMINLRKTLLSENSLIFPDEYMKFSVLSAKTGGGKVICSNKGYAFVEKDSLGECVISEILAEKDNIGVLLGEVLKNSKAEKFTFNYSPQLSYFKNERLTEDGMIQKLTDCNVNEVYIGLPNT